MSSSVAHGVDDRYARGAPGMIFPFAASGWKRALAPRRCGNRPRARRQSPRTARLLLAASAFSALSAVHAQTMEPLSYTNAPIGLNFAIAAYSRQQGSVLLDPTLPIKDLKATVETATVAYSRIIDFWGQSGSLALAVPCAWLTASGVVYGDAEDVRRTGMGDLTARLSINLVGAPALTLPEYAKWHQDLIIGVSILMTAPTGQYYPEKLINIGTNRWSFKPEVGISKALGPWTLEGAVGVTFFAPNDQFAGTSVRQQDPLLSLQGHAIYNFSPRLWAALDGTYYTGGRTTLNGNADNDIQSNSRYGGTVAYTVDRHNSLKLYFSSGLSARTGTNFKIAGIGWQYRWGGGL